MILTQEQLDAASKFLDRMKKEIERPSVEFIRDHIFRACRQAMWLERVDMEDAPAVEVEHGGDGSYTVDIETGNERVREALVKHGILRHMALHFADRT